MKIKVITVATEDNNNLQALKRSCMRNCMDLTILGLGEQWRGFGMKVILLKNYLLKLDESFTHFIFVDGYDTLFLRPITDIGNQILFSAEKACWPDAGAPYPPSTNTWRYLNSGVYCGPVKKFLELISHCPINFADDDQRYFTNIFLKSGKIHLDTGCSLFQSYSFVDEGEYSIEDINQLKNNKTGSYPAIVHFNGKTAAPDIYKMVEGATMQEVAANWKDESDYALRLNEWFVWQVNNNPGLNTHRTFVEQNVFGFGERAFPWLWNLVVQELPKEFTFLEIGVFKGQPLSLIELLAKMHKKKATRYGVTPLSTEGGVWESDYRRDIEHIHDEFKLAKDYELLEGLSEDPGIIELASVLQLDVLYIDGGHEERHITNDILNYAHLVKPGGFMVIDDCCNSFRMPFGYFQGIEIVTRVVDSMLPPVTRNEQWEFIFSVVHNRVYRRVK
jgi:hypothetical protein